MHSNSDDGYREVSGADRPQPNPLWTLLKPLASLRLTVILFVLTIYLVFVGTLAQVNQSMWTVLHGEFRCWWAKVPCEGYINFAQTFTPLDPNIHTSRYHYFPGGYTLGWAMLINLLAAHALRFKLTWRRSGVFVIHAGLILMLVGEWLTSQHAVEARMWIPQGGNSFCAIDFEHPELALIDDSPRDENNVVIVPGAILIENIGRRIEDLELPCDLEVRQYYSNSSPIGKSILPASRGNGIENDYRPKPDISGADPGIGMNMPSAELELWKKNSNESLGRFTVSTYPSMPQLEMPLQRVMIDGRSYQLALRFKPYFKPYTIYLIEGRFDRYIGTEKAKNYSSRVRLVDKELGEDREVLIRMNEPLRHRDDSLYQSGIEEGKDKVDTILQVVNNPGRRLPYWSCILVGAGMLIHFGINLVRFAERSGRVKR